MKTFLLYVGISLGLLIPLASSRAAGDRLELTVHAGEYERARTPVCVLVDVPADGKSVKLVDTDGRQIDAQLTAPGLLNEDAQGKSELHFLSPALEQGESARLTAQFSGEPATEGFSWKKVPGEHAELVYRSRPMIRYMCKTLTDKNFEEAFKVYHHVYNPAGDSFITKGPGGLWSHHRGLFFGYVRITYGDGKRADTWGSGRKTPEIHAGFLHKEAGPVLGRHLVSVHWCGADGEVFVREKREVAAFNTPGGTLIEFASQLTAASGRVILDGNKGHAGFQFRAAQEVADANQHQTKYLDPYSKEPTRFNLSWRAMSFVIAENRYTVLYMDRPENPKPAEYDKRGYGRFGSFFPYELDDDKKLAIKYRIWVQDGEMTVEEAASLSNNFVQPPRVTIE